MESAKLELTGKCFSADEIFGFQICAGDQCFDADVAGVGFVAGHGLQLRLWGGGGVVGVYGGLSDSESVSPVVRGRGLVGSEHPGVDGSVDEGRPGVGGSSGGAAGGLVNFGTGRALCFGGSGRRGFVLVLPGAE